MLVVVVVVGLLVVEIYIANAATELVSIAVVPCRAVCTRIFLIATDNNCILLDVLGLLQTVNPQ